MNLLLIMNRGSRAGRGKRQWKAWKEGLERAGVQYRCAQTERPGHALELARGADGYDAVAAVGGDGTINEVIDGLIQSGRKGQAMGVLYCGTSPDFCRFHSIPTQPSLALQALLRGTPLPVDVARIIHRDGGGGERLAHFACSCNIGMGASVARTSNRWRKCVGDRIGTAMAVVRALMLCAPADLEVEIDGETIHLPETNNLSIAKNPHLASGLRLNLDLLPDDGNLCVFGVTGKSRMALLNMIPHFYSGFAASAPGVFLRTCRSVTVSCPESREIEFDGDPRGFLPVRVEVIPKALNLIGASHE
jgi:diacylglycerol kinase family enzyme